MKYIIISTCFFIVMACTTEPEVSTHSCANTKNCGSYIYQTIADTHEPNNQSSREQSTPPEGVHTDVTKVTDSNDYNMSGRQQSPLNSAISNKPGITSQSTPPAVVNPADIEARSKDDLNQTIVRLHEIVRLIEMALKNNKISGDS